MADKVRIGVIGVGQIGKYHLDNYRKLDQAEIVAIADVNESEGQRVAERYKGPLAEELHRVLREIAMGKTRREALIDMAERVDLPDLETFVNSIVQAETLGTSVGQVLRVQASELRRKRRQHAEQVARQAPVKMVFPLVFFLIPCLFIVTLGPVVLNVMQAFED